MQATPVVTVGFPVYNGERYLRHALDSLLAQDHPSFEVVVSNNGSTDSTPAICETYAARDPRIRYLSSPTNRGAAWNFNNVVEHARGRYFMWAAHDDLWRPDCLSLYQRALDRDPEAVLVYCRAQPVGSEGEPIGEPYRDLANDSSSRRDRFRRVLENWQLHAAIYGMYRTEVLRRTRLILACVGCETVFIAEIALYGKTLEIAESCSMKRVPDPGIAYRSRTEQLEYLDPSLKVKRARPFLGLSVTREAIKGAMHARLSPVQIAAHAVDATAAYLHSRASVDVKEAISQALADRHPEALKIARALVRRIRRSARD